MDYSQRPRGLPHTSAASGSNRVPARDHALNASTIFPGTFSGSTESNNNLYGGYGGDCLNDNYGFHGFSGGSDRVYALEVGPGQTLSAEVTPEGDSGRDRDNLGRSL